MISAFKMLESYEKCFVPLSALDFGLGPIMKSAGERTSCPRICTISSIWISYFPLKSFESSVSVVPQQSISVLELP